MPPARVTGVGLKLPIARDLERNGIDNRTIAPGISGAPMLVETFPRWLPY